MNEILKLMWDGVVLEDASRKGTLDWRVWPVSFGAVCIVYGVGVPVGFLYDKYPQYAALWIAILALDVLFFLVFLVCAYRWQARVTAARKAAREAADQGKS